MVEHVSFLKICFIQLHWYHPHGFLFNDFFFNWGRGTCWQKYWELTLDNRTFPSPSSQQGLTMESPAKLTLCLRRSYRKPTTAQGTGTRTLESILASYLAGNSARQTGNSARQTGTEPSSSPDRHKVSSERLVYCSSWNPIIHVLHSTVNYKAC